MAFRSQAKVAQTNSLMCSYSSRRRTISFRFMARATSSMRRSPFHVLTRDHDLSHRSALAMSLLSTGRAHGLYGCLCEMWGSLLLVRRPCSGVYMDVVSQYDLKILMETFKLSSGYYFQLIQFTKILIGISNHA